jgi:SAM-dependent methyltransferase
MASKHPKASILDVGCGPGIYVKAMREAGLEASGVDSDPRLVEGLWLKRLDITRDPWWYVSIGSATRFAFGPTDVVLSLEVGEHIEEAKAHRYISFISDVGPEVVYFSAARPGQGGHGHINCQPKAYWVEKFHHAGFWLDPDKTDEWISWLRQGYHMGWLTQNGMIFRT